MTETYADDAGRFRLESRIATGGMGEVWRATDTVLGREVAVKLLKAEYADDPTFRNRFETEARHAAALHHPGVASVFDVGEAGSTDGSGHPRPFLVMELVHGEPLSRLLQDAQLNGRTLDAEAVRDLMAQTGDALGAAHRAGIVHRDVKPANLMVTPQGVVKVTDFGIARAAEGVGITRTGAVMGTPQYLSPEQAEGRPATSASDVYSLGVVAFECLAGRRPFEADSPVATALAHIREPVPDLPRAVPVDLAAVVRRALAKDPAERFSDGAAFAAALRNPATVAAPVTAPRPAPVVPVPVPESATQVLGQVPPAAPPTTSTRTTPAPGRSPWPIVVAVVVLLVALAIVITLLVTRGGGDDSPGDTTTSSGSRGPRSTPPSSEATSTSAPLDLVASDYVGRDIDDVAQELESMGLKVQRDSQDNTDPTQDGRVTGLDPSGAVQPGDVIQVSYFGDAPETPSDTTTPSDTPSTGGPSETPSAPSDTTTPGLPGALPTTEGAQNP